jgi:hypothetical protein
VAACVLAVSGFRLGGGIDGETGLRVSVAACVLAVSGFRLGGGIDGETGLRVSVAAATCRSTGDVFLAALLSSSTTKLRTRATTAMITPAKAT